MGLRPRDDVASMSGTVASRRDYPDLSCFPVGAISGRDSISSQPKAVPTIRFLNFPSEAVNRFENPLDEPHAREYHVRAERHTRLQRRWAAVGHDIL